MHRCHRGNLPRHPTLWLVYTSSGDGRCWAEASLHRRRETANRAAVRYARRGAAAVAVVGPSIG